MRNIIKVILSEFLLFSSLANSAPTPPINGGTGISNNNSNTISISSPVNLPRDINLQSAYNQSVAQSANSILLTAGGLQILDPYANEQFNIFTEEGLDYIINTGNTFIANTPADIVPNSAFFQVASTSQGSIPAPVMTQSQESSIAAPAQGMQVFNSTFNTLDYLDNTFSKHTLLATDNIIQGTNMTVTDNGDGTVTLASSGGGSSGTQVQGSFTSLSSLSSTSVTTSDAPINLASSSFNVVNAVGTTVSRTSVGGVTTATIQNNSTSSRWGIARYDLTMNFQTSGSNTFYFTVYKNTGSTLYVKDFTQTFSPGTDQQFSFSSPLVYLNPGEYMYLTVRCATGSAAFYAASFHGSWVDTSIAGIPNTDALTQGPNNVYLSQNGGSTYEFLSGSATTGHYASFNSAGGQLIDSGYSAGNINVSGATVINTTYYVPFTLNSSSTNQLPYTATDLTYSTNGVSNFLTAPKLRLSNLTNLQAVVSDGSNFLTSLAYTNANTASTLVERDSSGNFSAGTITAALTGNASTATTATNATNVATTSTSTNASFYPLFVASSSNSNQAANLATGLTYNPSTNLLSTTSLNLTGTEQLANLNPVNFYSGDFSAKVGQVGPTATSGKTDMGIYSSGSGNWLRIGNNNGRITFFVKGQVAVSDSFDDDFDSAGNLELVNAGTTVTIPTGTNACAGSGATLSSGTVTVSTTCAKTGDFILLMKTANGGTTTTGMPAVSINNGVSFTLTGSSLDTSTYSWVDFH